MDTIVTMNYMDSFKDLEEKRELFNSLTYRERKFSDTKQLELTGMCVNDFYELMKNNLVDNKPVNTPLEDILTESDEFKNKYNKTKFNSNIIDREIDKYTSELNRVNNLDRITFRGLPSLIKCKGDKELSKKDYIYKLEDNIAYLKTLKVLNERETTTYDTIMIKTFDVIVKSKGVDDKTKSDILDSIIIDYTSSMIDYDLSLSDTLDDESKMEELVKRISNTAVKKLLSYLVGPFSIVIDYTVKRSTNNTIMKIKKSTEPEKELEQYRNKMSNTLTLLEEKKKVFEKNKG